MIALQSAVVNWLLRQLDAPERLVVEGDLHELRVPWTRAVGELAGLLARRQIEAWRGWRPWMATAAFALPFGIILSLASRTWAYNAAMYAWFYVDNWTPGYLASPGARATLAQAAIASALECAALAVWSWNAAMAIQSISRRGSLTVFALFITIVFTGTIGSSTAGLLNPANAAVFS